MIHLTQKIGGDVLNALWRLGPNFLSAEITQDSAPELAEIVSAAEAAQSHKFSGVWVYNSDQPFFSAAPELGTAVTINTPILSKGTLNRLTKDELQAWLEWHAALAKRGPGTMLMAANRYLDPNADALELEFLQQIDAEVSNPKAMQKVLEAIRQYYTSVEQLESKATARTEWLQMLNTRIDALIALQHQGHEPTAPTR